jgi:hypothetical protein
MADHPLHMSALQTSLEATLFILQLLVSEIIRFILLILMTRFGTGGTGPEEEGNRIKSPDEHDSLSTQHREDTLWRKKRKSTYEGSSVSLASVTCPYHHSYHA